ncbi:MAG TPA: HEPN domain-containing protein [Azospirillaceae bacterium]|nr:HEPN domain-containing protein [Azospirillaceae bacterium]
MSPISYFDSVWQRCEEIKVLHSFLQSNLTSALSTDELLRSEWVARVSALDLYIHELIFQNMLLIFQGRKEKGTSFHKFECSSEALLRIKNSEHRVEQDLAFDLEVRRKLSRVTYQFPEDIADGVRLISKCELWNSVAIKRGANEQNKISAGKQIRNTLSLIIQRRNKIVHEGDLQPEPPRTQWKIDRADVDEASSFIHDIVYSIDSILSS